MEIIPFRFDHVENFFAVREFSSPVDLIIAEDNEATIKILLKGRSTKLRHVHRTHRVNLDWLYEVFASTNTRCRLRYVSTKHQIADMHTKAITKADVWNHLTKLGSLHSAQAGTIHRAKTLCLRICSISKMSSSSAFTGPDDFVYKCQTCHYVEIDVTKLQYKIGVSVILCCTMCSVLTEVAPMTRSEYLASGPAMASHRLLRSHHWCSSELHRRSCSILHR